MNMVDHSPEKSSTLSGDGKDAKGDYFNDHTVKARWSARPLLVSTGSSETPEHSPLRPIPETPRTPLLTRSYSSPFNSPSATFRADDDIFVLEFGSRFMRMGLGGESQPRACQSFGPEHQPIAGDYDISSAPLNTDHAVKDVDSWGRDHELWRMDLRDINLGLVADKIERAVRIAIIDRVLVMDDVKRRYYIVAVPSLMPHPLLTVLLTTLFKHNPMPPSITLLPIPITCALSAGLRSALVIDIGWAETTATAIYELREIQHMSSSRAMKLLSWEVACLLNLQNRDGPEVSDRSKGDVTFQESEDVLRKMIWCRTVRPESKTPDQKDHDDPDIEIPFRSKPSIKIPFSQFAKPTETSFFPSPGSEHLRDDNEWSLPYLTYATLLSLPVDIRQACLPRIVVTGGGASIPGLKKRLMSELSELIAKRGWDPVHNYGSTARRPKRTSQKQTGPIEVHEVLTLNKDIDPTVSLPAYAQSQLPDPILSRLQSRANNLSAFASPNATIMKLSTPIPQCIASRGAWAGASLAAGLRIRGMVEVEQENFMQYGLASADNDESKDRQSVQQAQKRTSLIGGVGNGFAKSGERSSGSWTLGMWG